MANEDVFRGARAALNLFYAYQNVVAQEIGMERAIALQTRADESMGTRQGKVLKEQSSIKEFDVKAAWSLLKTVKENFGVSYEVVEESPRRIVVRNGKCPFYEAAQAQGIDAKAIETGCRTGTMRIADALLKQLNPALNVRVRQFRSTPDGFCDEEIVLS